MAAGRSSSEATASLVHSLIAARRDFGITRVGSTTRLGDVPVFVVQAVRPMACSNVVSQGKGCTLLQATVSALMEALETWSGEHIPANQLRVSTALELGAETRSLYAGAVSPGAEAGWDHLPLNWLDGWDLFTGRLIPVPAALVDTVYTLPSPHPRAFPRTTTGLAAGPTLSEAVIHAGLEVLERNTVARAGFNAKVPLQAINRGNSAALIKALQGAGLIAGMWPLADADTLPVYRCHLMENGRGRELAPLPAEGFGCGFTHDEALTGALLEACQARVTAIAGGREDITRWHYPDSYDRAQLLRWRETLLAEPGGTLQSEKVAPATRSESLEAILLALRSAGARAAVVVPLYSRDAPRIEVVRLIAPPLRVTAHV